MWLRQHVLYLGALGLLAAACDPGDSPSPELSEQERESTRDPSGLTPDEYLAWYVDAHALGPDHRLVLDRIHDAFIRGSAVHKYRHEYEGVRVHTEGLALIVRAGHVSKAVGTVTAAIDARVSPSISEQAAITAVQEASGRSGQFASDGHHCELSLRLEHSGTSLQYLCVVIGAAPGGSYVGEVDAATGRARNVRRYALSNVDDFDVVPATAQTGWYGPEQVTVYRYTPSNTYYLHGPTIQVLDGANNTAVFPDSPNAIPVPYTSTTGIFGSGQAAGGAAYWGAEQTLDYLASTWSLTVPGVHIVSNLTGWGNARYDPDSGEIWIGSSGIAPNLVPQTAFDTIAHELGHKVAHQADLFDPELTIHFYGALSESFSDIIGELAEQHALGAADWIQGGDYQPVPGYRKLLDPHWSDPGQPDVFQGANYDFSEWDKHGNSSVPSLWFARLAGLVPGSGFTDQANLPLAQPKYFPFDVEPIGVTSAFLLYVRMLQIMPDGGNQLDAMAASIAAAKEFCGPASLEVVSVHNAWHSVGVWHQPVTSVSYSNPPDAAIDVHPWPVRLAWQANVKSVTETEWEVQVSTDATFPQTTQTTQSATTTDVDFESGFEVGVIEFVLEPNTTYYWRVRPLYADPNFACWRPTISFTTGDAAPDAFSPTGSNIHPWVIPFKYSMNPGATYYEIEVSETGNPVSAPDPVNNGRFDTVVFPPQIIPAVPNEPDQTANITVPKLKELVWHVRGVYEKAGEPTKYSGWSNILSFQTNEPVVLLHSPAHGSHQYPWPITLWWNTGPDELPGATYQVSSNSLNSWSGPHVNELTDNWLVWYHGAENQWADDNRGFEWWVEAKGPPLGSELTPEAEATREDARSSDRWIVYINGDPTEVKVQASPGPNCVNYGQSLNLQWPAVPEASYYEVTGMSAGEEFPGLAPLHTTNTSVTLQAVPATGSDNGNHVRAYERVKVVAMRENPHKVGVLIPGIKETTVNYSILPTKPSIVAIYPDATNPTEIDYDWVSTYNTTPSWKVKVYEGSTCSGSLAMSFASYYPPDQPGGTAYGATLFNLGPGAYSMKIAAGLRPNCPDSPWSDCAAFDFTPVPAEPPEILQLFTGSVWTAKHMFGWDLDCVSFNCGPEVLYYKFEPVPGADNYQIEFRPQGQPSTVYADQVGDAFLANQRWQFINFLCSSPGAPSSGCHAQFDAMLGTTYFGAYSVNEPWLTDEMRIRACIGTNCSAPSPWFTETYP